MRNQQHTAEEFAKSRIGDLKQVVGSEDGQKVKAMMNQNAANLRQAMQSGDMGTLKQTFDELMQTEEGARLIGKIQNMMP